MNFEKLLRGAVLTETIFSWPGVGKWLIESIARHAGYRTGLYQKPELVHFQERCKLDGAPVAAEALLPHFEAVEAARAEITLTPRQRDDSYVRPPKDSQRWVPAVY